jgi:hypothetical protein
MKFSINTLFHKYMSSIKISTCDYLNLTIFSEQKLDQLKLKLFQIAIKRHH